MKHKKIIVVTSILMIILTLLLVGYSYWKVVSLQKYEIKLSVGNRVGIDLGSQKISFGTMQPNSESTRKMAIKNDGNYPVKIAIKQEGNTMQFVSYNNNFIVNPKSTEEIIFSAKVPKDASYGNYTGIATVWVLRA